MWYTLFKEETWYARFGKKTRRINHVGKIFGIHDFVTGHGIHDA